MRLPLAALLGVLLATPAAAVEGERVQITGEVMDTWCYFSGVMGFEDAVIGTAHHTCALWCAAGGIPVGVLAEDGSVYLVLQWEGDAAVTGSETMLEVQSDIVIVDGILHERDGVKYLIVETVVDNLGIENLNHDDFGVTPSFAIPESAR